MKLLISLAAKEGIVKGSRVAVRQGSDYWIATVLRKGTDTASVQYDEGTKGFATLRSITHLNDDLKKIVKPQTKAQIDALKEKMKAAAKEKAAASKAKPDGKATKAALKKQVKGLPAFKKLLESVLGRTPSVDPYEPGKIPVARSEWLPVQDALQEAGFVRKLVPSKNPAFDKKHQYKKYTLTQGTTEISAIQKARDGRYYFILRDLAPAASKDVNTNVEKPGG